MAVKQERKNNNCKTARKGGFIYKNVYYMIDREIKERELVRLLTEILNAEKGFEWLETPEEREKQRKYIKELDRKYDALRIELSPQELRESLIECIQYKYIK